MDLVSYQKQGMVGVDLALDGKYSSGPRFVLKAGGGGGGSRFGWKVQLWTSFCTESRGWCGWTSLRVESTVMDLVSYRKQGMVGVDLASGGKYSCGPRFVPKAGGGVGGPRFGWKVQLWTSFRIESRGLWG